MKHPLIILGLICFSMMQANAQNNSGDLFHDSEGNSFHQVFLDFQATDIIEICYPNDDTPVDGQLSSDGYSVVIKNYAGNKSVKMKLQDSSGNVKEVTKSKCFIDPVLLNL